MNKLASDIVELIKKSGYEDACGVLKAVSLNAERALLCNDIYNCSECQLCKSTMQKVPGEGPSSPFMILGESAGEVENSTGRPFVGPAGQLLDKMLKEAYVDRDKIYITNVIKCHPPGNRNPELEEKEKCGKFLRRELEMIKPKHILVMGGVAASMFSDERISDLKGETIEFFGIPVTFTYHPAYVCRKSGDSFDECFHSVVADIKTVATNLVDLGHRDFIIDEGQTLYNWITGDDEVH